MRQGRHPQHKKKKKKDVAARTEPPTAGPDTPVVLFLTWYMHATNDPSTGYTLLLPSTTGVKWYLIGGNRPGKWRKPINRNSAPNHPPIEVAGQA
jgi:hypothetical protein